MSRETKPDEIHSCEICFGKPGSDTAVADGCLCPRLDNGRGHRRPHMVFAQDCPLHGWTQYETKEGGDEAG